jgi:hypothetical protein
MNGNAGRADREIGVPRAAMAALHKNRARKNPGELKYFFTARPAIELRRRYIFSTRF